MDVRAALSPQVSLLFSLWVETVRPYLQTVDEWIVHGHLCDCAREFIIQRWGRHSRSWLYLSSPMWRSYTSVSFTWSIGRFFCIFIDDIRYQCKNIFPSFMSITALLISKLYFWVIVCFWLAGMVKGTLSPLKWIRWCQMASLKGTNGNKLSVRQKVWKYYRICL